VRFVEIVGSQHGDAAEATGTFRILEKLPDLVTIDVERSGVNHRVLPFPWCVEIAFIIYHKRYAFKKLFKGDISALSLLFCEL
jgi:hypothetical protein